MRQMLMEHKDGCKKCPFNFECMHCYELFPEWGEMFLHYADWGSHQDPIRSCPANLVEISPPGCPCFVMDKEFVSKQVHLFIERTENAV